MSIIAKLNPTREFEPLDPGTHLARCNAVISVGWQKSDYGTKDTVYLRFEVPAERKKFVRDGIDVDEPATIWCRYTNNLHEMAKLRKHLDTWLRLTEAQLQDGFYLDTLLGRACIITVIHKHSGDKTHHNVAGVANVMKGQTVPPQELPSIFFGPEDTDQWDDVPKFLQDKYDEMVDLPINVASVQAETISDSATEEELDERDYHDDDSHFDDEAA